VVAGKKTAVVFARRAGFQDFLRRDYQPDRSSGIRTASAGIVKGPRGFKRSSSFRQRHFKSTATQPDNLSEIVSKRRISNRAHNDSTPDIHVLEEPPLNSFFGLIEARGFRFHQRQGHRSINSWRFSTRFVQIILRKPNSECLAEVVCSEAGLNELPAIVAAQKVNELRLFDSDNDVAEKIPNPVGRDVIPVRQKSLEHPLLKRGCTRICVLKIYKISLIVFGKNTTAPVPIDQWAVGAVYDRARLRG
jgi:hypothetical protein